MAVALAESAAITYAAGSPTPQTKVLMMFFPLISWTLFHHLSQIHAYKTLPTQNLYWHRVGAHLGPDYVVLDTDMNNLNEEKIENMHFSNKQGKTRVM